MKYIFKSFILIMILGLVSCEKTLQEVNIDPNVSPVANEAQVLTAAQGYLGYIVDVDLNSASFLWAQYYTWGIGVSIGNQERYVSQPDDFDGYWSRAYANSLTDLDYLTESDNPSYRGIGKVLQAYIYQGLTDHFGDIPFSNALKGEIADGSVLTPTFDDAASVYDGLVVLIDDAIKELNAPTAENIGASDLIYGGDLGKWKKFANSLKLRILLRTSEIEDNSAAITSLISSGDFIELSSDNASMAFEGSAGNQNPMFARFSFGVGDFYFASNATLNVLDGLNDPRSTAFYSIATTGTFMGNLNGINQGTIDDEPFTNPPTHYSGSSPLVFGTDQPVMLMSAWEVWFLRAEAAARYGTSDNDQVAFEGAVQLNFNFFGVEGATEYVASLNYADASTLDAKLDLIAVQKWISLNGTQEDEGWIETRRFDRPASRLFTEGIFQNPPLSVLPAGTYPASWLYPASERSLNPNAPAQRQITDRLFWDN